ncbi:retinol dehydrogenase 12-like [Oppia nitens]|uniref:retinol dehydrogenase 12-like n=1 Tax=Oppia nitens TaxID=1686743 RepID=UPI0023DA7A0B|nr:retinol dehydrogenase 12-like [Oppia nitens]
MAVISEIIIDYLIIFKYYAIYLCKCFYEFFITNKFKFRKKCKSNKRLDGKVVVITGGNTGIGKETALQLSLRGAKIIIGCRNVQKGEIAVQDIIAKNVLSDIRVLYLDLSSLSSVRQFAQTVTQLVSKLDILINNAGVMMTPESTTEDGFELQFGTNFLAHFLLIHCLMPLLIKSSKARIVNLSSICHILGKIHFNNINLKDGHYRPLKAYSQSKLAIVLMTREMARRLGTNTNITVYSLHPGVIQTEITRHFPAYLYYLIKPFMTTIELGTQTTLYCAIDETLDNQTGLYYDDCKRVNNMIAPAIDDNSAKKLWELATDLVNLEDSLKI